MLFHRFYLKQSFGEHDRFEVALCSIFLACKVEETPKKVQQVIITCHAVKVENKARVAAAAAAAAAAASGDHPPTQPPQLVKKAPELDPKGEAFLKLRDRVLLLERVLLHTLSFDLSVEHPYKYLIEEMNKIRIKGLEKDPSSHSSSSAPPSTANNKAFANDLGHRALNLINDSYHTRLCLRFPPKVLALSCILVAARALKVVPYLSSWADLLTPQECELAAKAVEAVARDLVEITGGREEGGSRPNEEGGGGAKRARVDDK